MSKEFMFHCGRYPSLTLTITPFGVKDAVGGHKPAKHLRFGADVELGAGILRVSSEEHAAFVRKHEYFKNGKIIEVSEASDIPAKKVEAKVHAGVHSSSDTRLPSGAPVDGDQKPKAARVPKR